VEILAIIPARGGSKGLPGKNIRPLNGHPLIAYSILAAISCKSITRVIVSTDSEEIAAVARQYGAEVPFIRPADIAADMSTDLEVFRHALSYMEQADAYVPDYVVQLRPTSPIRFAADIETCITKLLRHQEADSLRIVTESPITPYKMWTINDPGKPMTPLLSVNGIEEPYNEPRQRLPKTYWQIGTLDVIKTAVITEQNSMSGKSILPHVIDSRFAVDIDDIQSFSKASEVLNNYDCIKF
jgi:CMP-N,N'-diacetyllegionaminic acid synthase